MIKHHTKDKGDLAVLKVQADLCEKGYVVCVPHTEHAPFDLVAYKDHQFTKLQVKYRAVKKGVILVPMNCSWADKNGTHSRRYVIGDFDLMAVYCPDTRECYYVPWDVCCKVQMVTLRISKARGKSQHAFRMASDFMHP